MKRDFNQTFTTLEGQPIKDGDKELTLREAALASLQAVFQEDRSLSGTEKIRRYTLALRIHAGDPVELTAEDVTLIKDLINRAYGHPAVVAQAWQMLDADPA
jgi:hypothetical protein